MTLTQYLIAWIVYLLAAAGCLLVWWKLTHRLNATLASWLRMWATVAVLTPGFTSQDMTWMTPALPATLFDLLSYGPDSLARNGIILVGALALTSLVKLLFFRSSRKAGKQPAKASASKTERSESRVSL